MNRKALTGVGAVGGIALAAGLVIGLSGPKSQPVPLDTATVTALAAQADNPSPSTAPTGPQPGTLGHKEHPRRPWLRGVHGVVTVRRDGKFVNVAFQRGTLTSVSGGTLAVRSADGTNWTWATTGKTIVRKQGQRTNLGALAAGDKVFVAGPTQGSSRTAALVVVPRQRPAPQDPSPTPSTSAS